MPRARPLPPGRALPAPAALDAPARIRADAARTWPIRSVNGADPDIVPGRELVVVTNRPPPSAEALSEHGTAGGLVASLLPVMQRTAGTWVSGGPMTPTFSRHQEPGADGDVFTRVAASYPQRLHRGFYDGIANGLIWPVFHGLVERMSPCSYADWEAYVQVNESFAEASAAAGSADSFIWVHDYQLCLVPRLIRQRRPDDARIGFYLHTPFPSCDTFRTLPWSRELLEGMLGADLIGFHTDDYRRNFMDCAERILELPVDRPAGLVHVGPRTVRLRVIPVSIDAAGIHRTAARTRTRQRATALRDHVSGARLLLGVDRLDYTKGIDRRLQAIDLLLERSPHWRGRVSFVQIAVPSRDDIDAYRDLRRQIEFLVGHLNGKWSTPDWTPVTLMCRSFGHEELVAWYLAADVALVTPLRDGLNLVAKEYCAAQRDGAGVLVLSEFAGAAAELNQAILTNPFDLDGLRDSIERALQLPGAEARRRMQRMNQVVSAHDCQFWVQSFLGAARCL